MSTEFLPREAFADEQSYIAHRQHVAALQRAERLKRQEAKSPRRKHWEKAHLSPALQTWHRMKDRENTRRYYWQDVEKSRASTRERKRREYSRHPDVIKARHRRFYKRHSEERKLYQAAYRRDHADELRQYWYQRYWTHREEMLQRQREYRERNHEHVIERSRNYYWRHRDEDVLRRRAAYRASHPGSRSQEEIYHAAQIFEEQVVTLRAEGWMWKEVAELTGKSERGCKQAYIRWKKRQQEYHDTHEQSA